VRLDVTHTWDGHPIARDERVRVDLRRVDGALELRVDAPWHGDPPPASAPGPTPRLWEHEVVELFLAGPADRYLEVELGPHGHHLVLWLDGVRRPTREAIPIDYVVARAGDRWTGRALLGPQVPLPDTPWRANAYAIHGVGDRRRWLAHAPVQGPQPDFHRLDRFVPIRFAE